MANAGDAKECPFSNWQVDRIYTVLREDQIKSDLYYLKGGKWYYTWEEFDFNSPELELVRYWRELSDPEVLIWFMFATPFTRGKYE